ncbi:MAG: methyltransferase domain-containing protein [Planctomycetes bacterium]|nr:methyltransferase domain-containing protein [Planctomycetota bacterium]
MKKALHRTIAALLLAFWIGGLSGSAAFAAGKDSPELRKLREDFIHNFHRLNINTTPGDATFLRILVESSGAKRGVEVGTATGYGALHMGWGFERTGGHLITIDIDPKMVEAARENIKKMQLQDSVTVVQGDALQVLPKLEGTFDFVFIDAVKRDYLRYFKAIEPKLVPGAIIVADNVIRFRNQMLDFLQTVENDPNYLMVVIRASELKKDGMAVIYKLK